MVSAVEVSTNVADAIGRGEAVARRNQSARSVAANGMSVCGTTSERTGAGSSSTRWTSQPSATNPQTYWSTAQVAPGRFGSAGLEWLAQAGADIYTSDEAGRDPAELSLLVKSAARGGAFVSYFQYGPASDALTEAAGTGLYLHLTNRERPRDFDALAGLADTCRRANAWLVYYHHGPSAAGLAGVAGNGGWVHLTDGSVPRGEGLAVLLDAARDAAGAGSGVVLHLDGELDAPTVEDLMTAGVFVIFGQPHDFRSPFRELERRAARRRLDGRAYYLTADFLP